MRLLSFLGALVTLFYYSSCACVKQGQLVGYSRGVSLFYSETADTNLAVLDYYSEFFSNYFHIHLVNQSKIEDTLTTNAEQKLYYLPPATYSIIIPHYITLYNVEMKAGEITHFNFRRF